MGRPRIRPFTVHTDQESGQTIMKAWASCTWTSRSTSLKRTYKVEANIGAPQVAYRESLGKVTDIDYTHKKQTGGTGQFARVKIKFEPGEQGSGFVFRKLGGSAARCRRNSSPASRRAWSLPRKTACWPASR